jgi:RNA-directed DNA polymerase
MKSYCKGLVIDEATVRRAYFAWTKSQAGHKNAWRVAEEYGSADILIAEIASEIAGRSLSLRPIKRYQHREPTNGKMRTIGVESIKQQVCDYVAITALEPLLSAKVGFWQVSSVKGKGQLLAAKTIRRWTREGGYHVHLDVRKCYPSIRAPVVMRILSRYVRSPEVLYLCGVLLSTYEDGLEIGSYFSLRMAQLVLSCGYHAVEDMHKHRRGKRVPLVTHQLWYADDIYLFGPDKRNLKIAIRKLQSMLKSDMGLIIKPWKICRVGDDEPVDALGYVVRPKRTTIRPKLFLRACRAFRRFRRCPTLPMARRVASYWGWFRHSDSTGAIARNGFGQILKDAKALIRAEATRKAAYEHLHALSNAI